MDLEGAQLPMPRLRAILGAKLFFSQMVSENTTGMVYLGVHTNVYARDRSGQG